MEISIKKRNVNIETYVPVSSKVKHKNATTDKLPKHVNVSQVFNVFDRYFFHLKHYKIKKHFFRYYNPSVNTIVHAHSLFSNGYIAYLNYKKNQNPYIVAVRNTDLNLFFKHMFHLRGLGNKILLNAEKVIFLSKSYQDKCITKYVLPRYQKEVLRKSSIIPNGIDNFWFDNKYTRIKTKSDTTLRIIFVGDITKNKNIVNLVNACKIIINKGRRLNLTVIGRVKNKRIYNDIKNKSFVKFKGYLKKDQLLDEYRNNDIFVLPSKRETFGLVYAEAMSQGLPIIYTKGQGFDTQFKDGVVGYSVNSDDIEQISKKILEIYINYEKYTINTVKNVEKFNWESISYEYYKIYRDIKC